MERDIRAEIIDELRWDPRIDATKISVTVIDGLALLGGSVHTYAEKCRCASTAINLKTALDSVLPLHIRDGCWIEIASDGGRATLSGTVHRCAQRDNILDLVWCAPGERAVEDRLSVLP